MLRKFACSGPPANVSVEMLSARFSASLVREHLDCSESKGRALHRLINHGQAAN